MERILVIGMSGDCGGIENYLLNMYEHIDHGKIQFDFLVKEEIGETFTTRIKHQGGEIFTVGTLKKDVFRVVNRIRKIFFERKYQKVYVNLSYFPTMIYVLPGLRYLNHIFIHSHASDDNRKKKHFFFRKLLFPLLKKNSELHYMGCSEDACFWMFGKDECTKHGFTVINNAIEFEKFSYDENMRKKIRHDLGLGDNFVVGHVGRFNPEKNHKFIIEAFRELHQKNHNTRLLLIGDGKLFDEIKKMVFDYSLSDVVTFTGVIADSYKYYNAMDCFWLPSIFEGLPMVAIEAETNGLPCLFSDRITRDVDVIGNNQLLCIEKTEFFVYKTLEIDRKWKRTIEYSDFVKTGYDIITESNKLEVVLLSAV